MFNWISDPKSEITAKDKIKDLLQRPYKLVLIQQQELETLRTKDLSIKETEYINNLYNHYIVEGKGKSYNYSN